MANRFKKAAPEASRLYKTGRYKTYADAMKAALKKTSAVGTAKKKFRQTGSSNRINDMQRKAKAPGKRKSASGNTYIERRKNRSDKPGSLTGVSAATLKGALRQKINAAIDKAVIGKFHATKKRDKKKYQKIIVTKKTELRKLS